MWKSCVITHIVDPSTVCQCTGLKDKNGNLIWENDIVSHECTEKNYSLFSYTEKRKNYVIKWDNTMFHCGFRYRNGRNIGNIFDNPELLHGN